MWILLLCRWNFWKKFKTVWGDSRVSWISKNESKTEYKMKHGSKSFYPTRGYMWYFFKKVHERKTWLNTLSLEFRIILYPKFHFMYKTIGQMGCDRGVGEMPYRWGNFKWLQIMIQRQVSQENISWILGNGNDTERYLSYSWPRMAQPLRNRDILCLPPWESLTPEDFDEYPDKNRIDWINPFWMQQLLAWTISPLSLGLTGMMVERLWIIIEWENVL